MRGPGRGFPARVRGWVAAAFALAALLPSRAPALGPHEVLLLVNADSADSVVLGSAYARLRGIPQHNVVRLSVPCGEDGAPPVAITKEEFERLIWNPARAAVAERGLDGRVLAWVYSCGFPARVADSPDTVRRQGPSDLSLTGATFAGCRWPDADEVRALSRDGRAAGVLLTPIPKDGFFAAVRAGGTLPRKTFSMGVGHEKRYYMECPRIRPE